MRAWGLSYKSTWILQQYWCTHLFCGSGGLCWWTWYISVCRSYQSSQHTHWYLYSSSVEGEELWWCHWLARNCYGRELTSAVSSISLVAFGAYTLKTNLSIDAFGDWVAVVQLHVTLINENWNTLWTPQPHSLYTLITCVHTSHKALCMNHNMMGVGPTHKTAVM